ncbi:hypothetical protein [Bradyrhizobium sp. ORS 375]|uniref:hypothetical protein n=1 Tax=Bradyrhizobium sp. (strain ORS 375) TaxID=566679 RepID=UPI001111BEB8|nr:hypothetical protein [Bradyrhizobium sp. ORS 375]
MPLLGIGFPATTSVAVGLAARRRAPAGAVTWGTCFCSGRAFARCLAGAAFAAPAFDFRALRDGVLEEVVFEVDLDEVVLEEIALEGVFTPRVFALAGLDAAG